MITGLIFRFEAAQDENKKKKEESEQIKLGAMR